MRRHLLIVLAVMWSCPVYAADPPDKGISLGGNSFLRVRGAVEINRRDVIQIPKPFGQQSRLWSESAGRVLLLGSDTYTFEVVFDDGRETVVDTVKIDLPAGVRPSAEPLFCILSAAGDRTKLTYLYRTNYKTFVARAGPNASGALSVNQKRFLTNSSLQSRIAQIATTGNQTEIRVIGGDAHLKIYRQLGSGEFVYVTDL